MEDSAPTQRNYGAMERLSHIPLRAQLLEQKHHHEKETLRINALLELLDQNPAIEQFVNLQRGYL